MNTDNIKVYVVVDSYSHPRKVFFHENNAKVFIYDNDRSWEYEEFQVEDDDITHR